MISRLVSAALCASVSLCVASPDPQQNFQSLLQQWKPAVIDRDVVIIGGGSSGTYSAIRLKDSGKSVAVIEAKKQFGGHTETYFDQASGKYHDYGVVILHDNDIVKNYYGRLGVPLGSSTFPAGVQKYFDFHKNEVLSEFTPTDPRAALQRYAEQLAKYPYLLDGYAGLPDSVPEDLLLPLGDFLEKYDAQDAINILAQFNQGIGNPLNQTTLYMAKQINLDILRYQVTGFLANANGNNHEIYDKAQLELGNDALLNSAILAVDRSGNGVRVLVLSSGLPKLIQARKLLISIPLKPSQLLGWDLSTDESTLFSKFKYTGYYTAVLRNTGIPANTTINNVGKETLYNLPSIPGPYMYSSTNIDNLFDLKYGTEELVDGHSIKSLIIQDLKKLSSAGLIPELPVGAPEFVRFASHSPFAPTVSVEEIRGGFYKKLYALQGQRNTYYTGAAFETQDSSMLWAFTEQNVLPLIE